MTRPILEVKDLNFSYDTEKPILKKINLAIHSGEKIALIGPNGAGKSTLLYCLDGINEAYEGSLVLKGKLLRKKRSHFIELRETVGLIFQDYDVSIIGPSVESDISFGLINMGLSKNEVEARVSEVLETMGLTSVKNRPPHFLSGGQKRMLNLAGVIAMKPEIILLDEPTSSLDARGTELMVSKLDELNESGTALLISSHDADFVYEWADRIILLSQGEVLKQGTPHEVYSDIDLLRNAGVSRPRIFDIYETLKGESLPKTARSLEDLL